MGSFRRPRPRFMSSPVLSDLARFHASSPTLQLSNASVWNSHRGDYHVETCDFKALGEEADSNFCLHHFLLETGPPMPLAQEAQSRIVQTAVIKVFQGGSLQSNELYTLNESIRWLLRTELGSFITEYFQDQLLNKGLTYLLEKIRLHDVTYDFFHLQNTKEDQLKNVSKQTALAHVNIQYENLLQALCEMWVRFYTEILPTLQAIFYPVQGQELTVRQMALLGFRDMVLLKLPVENMLNSTSYPPPITQMFLILQGIHKPNGPTQEYLLLERLVEMVISPYLANYLYLSQSDSSSGEDQEEDLRTVNTPHHGQPDITVTQFVQESFLAPLIEHEGEAYLENTRGIRRHTVANVQSDIQLLSVKNRMFSRKIEVSGATCIIETGKKRTPMSFLSESTFFNSMQGDVDIQRGQSNAEIQCGLNS